MSFGVFDADTGAKRHSETGRWLQKICEGVGPVEVDGSYLVPEGGEVDVAGLAVEAARSVVVPAPRISSSPSRDRGLVVQVPTWWWLPEQWWRTYEATASAGRVTATVTVRPLQAQWKMGDGVEKTCGGPGVPWRPGAPTNDPAACIHTYRSSSAGEPAGRLRVGVTVTLAVAWTSNVGDSGTLDDLTRSETVSVVVGEIQAIGR